MDINNFKDIIHYRQKGWFEVGHTRMIFFDILQGFYNLRKVISEEVGDNAGYLIFQAGIKGGFSFLEPMIQKGHIQANEQGFAHGLSVFTDAGAGYFRIKDMEWDKGWSVIACDNSFEGWVYSQKKGVFDFSLCDYTRGIILGFMQVTHQYAGTGLSDSLDCVETSCLATGHARCEFIVGEETAIRAHGYKCSRPGKSIQDQLRERVYEKTKEIREAHLLNENIIQSITEGIMVLDPSLKILTWNRQMESIFQLESSSVLGKQIEEAGHCFSESRLIASLKKVLLSGVPFERNGLKFDTDTRGTIILHQKIIPLFDEYDNVSGIIVLSEDITQRERIEIRYQNLFEAANDGICLTDLEGCVVTLNRKFLKFLGIERENLIGTSLDRFLSPDKRQHFHERLNSVIDGQDIEPYELEFVSSSNEVTPVELNITAVREEERIFGLHILARDITTRKMMEQQMIQSGKLAAVGELASGVAHEINNPLASVAGYAEEMLDILNENGRLDYVYMDELKEALSTIMEQTHRCKEITQNLLNFARQGDSQFILTSINDLIIKTLFLVDPEVKAGKTTIAKKLDPGLEPVETDPSQIQQVFINILKNALDAMEPGGLLEITSCRSGDFVRVGFRDNGNGIPPEHIKKIFNPFFTTKSPGKGTGLGLSICFGIMKKLNGSIEAESRPGSGSIFTVNIPRNRSHQPEIN